MRQIRVLVICSAVVLMTGCPTEEPDPALDLAEDTAQEMTEDLISDVGGQEDLIDDITTETVSDQSAQEPVQTELWQVLGTFEDRIEDIGGTSATDVWVVGEEALAQRYTGSEWLDMSPPTFADLNAIDFTSDGFAWIAGDEVILTWDGNSFEEVEVPADLRFERVVAVSETEAWVLSSGESLYHYESGDWDFDRFFKPEFIDGGLDGEVWVAFFQGPNIYQWDGSDWQVEPVYEESGTIEWEAIHVTDDGEVWIVGEDRLFHRDSGGWDYLGEFEEIDVVQDIWGIGDDLWIVEGWVVGLGVIFAENINIRHWDGQDMTLEYHVEDAYVLRGVWGLSDSMVFAANSEELLQR